MDIMAAAIQFSQCYIEHPLVKSIMTELDKLRAQRLLSKDQQCILITGEAGTGKSALIDYYKIKDVAINKSTEKTPVLLTRISAKRDLDSTLIQMLYDLELFGVDQYKRRGFATNLEQKLVNALKRAQVELIIINEFQEILEYKSMQERQAIGNSLKYISEEAQVPIAFVGMPWAAQICEDPQWASRLIRRRKLTHFCFKDIEKRRYYLSYLKGLANRMPFASSPDLASPPIAIPLFAATNGENRFIKELLKEALIIALEQGDDTMKLEHLSEAYALVVPDQPNVFELPLELLQLKEIENSSRMNFDTNSVEQLIIGPQYTRPIVLSDILSLK
ncbi:TniB family NTP-binding protein [uncultured Shewanella sp.]|uniref:TniB family NTP-binding protein n=1 Tax=uncultured Shewanella sp. TaxID=173975 RepID=UPI0034590159